MEARSQRRRARSLFLATREPENAKFGSPVFGNVGDGRRRLRPEFQRDDNHPHRFRRHVEGIFTSTRPMEATLQGPADPVDNACATPERIRRELAYLGNLHVEEVGREVIPKDPATGRRRARGNIANSNVVLKSFREIIRLSKSTRRGRLRTAHHIASGLPITSPGK